MRTSSFCLILILAACGAETDPDNPNTPNSPPGGDVAGDGACTGSESAATTPEDCPAVRGDGYCTHDETAASADNDCTDVRGDGLCTGNENAANTPQDCPTSAGDGLCTGTETPANTPQDCPDVVGDHLCTGDETATTAPNDCPAIPGDGTCSGGENASNTPQDCPAILGDGYCTHNETPANALQDCPPPDLVFSGGSVAGLEAVSPTLYFGELTLTGQLTLTPSDNEVILHVENFSVTSSGWVKATWSTCEYSSSPSLTVIATGNVVIDGGIDVGGRSGVRATSSATCNSCYGEDGGHITIVGDTIDVGASLRTDGGRGSQSVYSDYSIGCSGGDAGDIILTASQSLGVDTDVSLDGGNGGIGSTGMPAGDDGDAGATFWDAPVVTVEEQESNGIVDMAQRMPFSPLTVNATISATDDIDKANNAGVRQVVFPEGPDRIEDLYFVTNYGAGSATYLVELTATADVDLYIIDAAGWNIVQQDNGPSTSQSLTLAIPGGQGRFIGISHWEGEPATDYTLTIR